MAKLQNEFNKVGLVHYTGRAHVMTTQPTIEQAKKLKDRGIDVSSQRLFACSPRKG